MTSIQDFVLTFCPHNAQRPTKETETLDACIVTLQGMLTT